jgi:integrase
MVLNYHIGLSALWTWAVAEDLAPEQVVQKVKCAKPEKKAIKPYSEVDVKAMLAALGRSRSYTRPRKGETSHSLLNQERNRAMILLLLDTGVRAEALCGLKMHDLDVKNKPGSSATMDDTIHLTRINTLPAMDRTVISIV